MLPRPVLLGAEADTGGQADHGKAHQHCGEVHLFLVAVRLNPASAYGEAAYAPCSTGTGYDLHSDSRWCEAEPRKHRLMARQLQQYNLHLKFIAFVTTSFHSSHCEQQ